MSTKSRDLAGDMDHDLLKLVVELTTEFTAPPAILSRIIELTDDPGTPVEKVATALASEPAIATRVLKLSNSAFFGRSREISSIREAVVMLGYSTIRSLVVATAAHGLYCQGGPQQALRYRMWDHSLATAVCSRLLAADEPLVGPEAAYLGGLLHDVGKLVFLDRWPEHYLRILHASGQRAASPLELENETFGFSHALLGASLLDQWLFPEHLTVTVALHHEARGQDPLIAIVARANRLVTSWGYNLYTLPQSDNREATDVDEAFAQAFVAAFQEQKALFDNG